MWIFYILAFLCMFLESSFLPFPSEPFVLYLAYLINLGKLNFLVVYLILVIGSLCGALLNYYLSKKYGLKFFKRWTDTDIIKKFLKKFDEDKNFYTFIFRFVPVLRQVMSIPAGIVNMKLSHFVFFSLLGIAIWNFILLYLCVKVTDPVILKNHLLTIGIIAFLLVIIYVLLKKVLINEIKKRMK